jgi:glycyl-tRNA synthetase beta chain
LQGFLASPDGGNLLTAYRRAGNIVRIETKRDGRRYDGTSDPAKFAAPEEKALNHGLDRVSEATARALAAEAFEDAMRTMATLRPSIDAFFDRVTVNTEDRELRENRLRLLARIQATLDSVADFTKIEG